MSSSGDNLKTLADCEIHLSPTEIDRRMLYVAIDM